MRDFEFESRLLPPLEYPYCPYSALGHFSLSTTVVRRGFCLIGDFIRGIDDADINQSEDRISRNGMYGWFKDVK
jgi:hypothetical protein